MSQAKARKRRRYRQQKEKRKWLKGFVQDGRLFGLIESKPGKIMWSKATLFD